MAKKKGINSCVCRLARSVCVHHADGEKRRQRCSSLCYVLRAHYIEHLDLILACGEHIVAFFYEIYVPCKPSEGYINSGLCFGMTENLLSDGRKGSSTCRDRSAFFVFGAFFIGTYV